MTLDKLPAIRGDLVRTDPTWESWDFGKLAEALRQWTRRNPATASATSERDAENRKRDRPSKLFQAQNHKPRGCVYCGDVGHKATQCHNVADKAERKQTLAKKKLCFNCALETYRTVGTLATRQLSATTSLTRPNASRHWRRRSCVSIVPWKPTVHRNAQVRRPAINVTNVITPQSVTKHRREIMEGMQC